MSQFHAMKKVKKEIREEIFDFLQKIITSDFNGDFYRLVKGFVVAQRDLELDSKDLMHFETEFKTYGGFEKVKSYIGLLSTCQPIIKIFKSCDSVGRQGKVACFKSHLIFDVDGEAPKASKTTKAAKAPKVEEDQADIEDFI